MNVNLVAGRRSDSAHGYLHPVRAVQNYVHLIIDALVISILFDETTARHLEYINQSIYIADSLMFRNFRGRAPAETTINFVACSCFTIRFVFHAKYQKKLDIMPTFWIYLGRQHTEK